MLQNILDQLLIGNRDRQIGERERKITEINKEVNKKGKYMDYGLREEKRKEDEI